MDWKLSDQSPLYALLIISPVIVALFSAFVSLILAAWTALLVSLCIAAICIVAIVGLAYRDNARNGC